MGWDNWDMGHGLAINKVVTKLFWKEKIMGKVVRFHW